MTWSNKYLLSRTLCDEPFFIPVSFSSKSHTSNLWRQNGTSISLERNLSEFPSLSCNEILVNSTSAFHYEFNTRFTNVYSGSDELQKKKKKSVLYSFGKKQMPCTEMVFHLVMICVLLFMANAVSLRGEFCILDEPQSVCDVFTLYRQHATFAIIWTQRNCSQKLLTSSIVLHRTEFYWLPKTPTLDPNLSSSRF